MTKDDIIRMAREVGLPHWYQTEGVVNEALLIKFAALVASAERERLTDAAMKAAEKSVDVAIALEREACAKVAESIAKDMTDLAQWGATQCANSIRKRGQA